MADKTITVGNTTYKHHTELKRNDDELESDFLLRVTRKRQTLRLAYMPNKTYVKHSQSSSEVIKSSIYIEIK